MHARARGERVLLEARACGMPGLPNQRGTRPAGARSALLVPCLSLLLPVSASVWLSLHPQARSDKGMQREGEQPRPSSWRRTTSASPSFSRAQFLIRSAQPAPRTSSNLRQRLSAALHTAPHADRRVLHAPFFPSFLISRRVGLRVRARGQGGLESSKGVSWVAAPAASARHAAAPDVWPCLSLGALHAAPRDRLTTPRSLLLPFGPRSNGTPRWRLCQRRQRRASKGGGLGGRRGSGGVRLPRTSPRSRPNRFTFLSSCRGAEGTKGLVNPCPGTFSKQPRLRLLSAMSAPAGSGAARLGAPPAEINLNRTIS